MALAERLVASHLHGESLVEQYRHIRILGGRPLPKRLLNSRLIVSSLGPMTTRFAGKGILQGSGVNNWDVNLSKNFVFKERHRIQFRAEFFNFFNHAQFDDPVLQPAVRNAAGVLLNPNAGKVTSASDFGFRQTERVVQLGLKYAF